MAPPAARTVSRVEIEQSRQLISASRVRIASAKALITRSHQSLARQTYLMIVCAWCQRTMRWQRTEGAVWGQISHSICFDCCADVMFPELTLGNARSPLPTKGDMHPERSRLRLLPSPRPSTSPQNHAVRS